MINGLSGILAGYNGTFDFKSGENYPTELNYSIMRIVNAFFGALCVPVAFMTAVELGYKPFGSILVAMMVLCGTLCQLMTSPIRRKLIFDHFEVGITDALRR